MRQTYASKRYPERLRDHAPYSFILFSSLFSFISCRKELLYLNAKRTHLHVELHFYALLKCPLLPFSSCKSSQLTTLAHSQGTLICGDLDHSIWMHTGLNTLQPFRHDIFLLLLHLNRDIASRRKRCKFRLQGSAKWLHLCQAHAIAAYLL